MKANGIMRVILCLSVACFLSCAREEYDPCDGQMTFYAKSADTRTQLKADGTVLWSPRDEILVYHNDYQGCFSSTNTTASSSAEFRGVLPGFVRDEDKYFYAVYPYSREIECQGNVFGIPLPSGQVAVEGSFADDLFISMARSWDEHLSFFNVCGGVKFSVAKDGIKKVVFKANGGESIAGKLSVAFSVEGLPALASIDDGSSSVTLTAPEGESFQKGKWYYMVLAPQTLSQGYTIEFYSNSLEGKVVHNSSIRVIRSVWGVLSGLEPAEYAEMEPVDLGLSVKWGNMNLGADKLSEYGDYYAWGETLPNKPSFSWSNYAWGTPSNGFTKYASSQGYSVLVPGDDAASVSLGGYWRMATIEEFQELYDECTWEKTELGGVVCYRVSRNGNHIYLPAYPGYYEGDALKEQGSGGYYWSSSVLSSNRSYAQNLWIAGSPSLQQGYRYYGEVIRPVYDDAWHSVTGVSIQSDYYVAVGSERALEAIVLPSNASDQSLDWSSSDPSVATVSESGVVHGVSKGMATITVTTKDGGKTASSTIHVVSKPEPVDLGLSVQWASFNLGASVQEERGDYFAWGETEPYYTYDYQNPLSWHPGKGNGYVWSSYQWMDFDTLTKYSTSDRKTVLEPEDDAACMMLGGMWRMPTREEWTELRTKCTWNWTSLNGVNGREVTGPSGKRIFLPAAGYRAEIYLDDLGTDGYYWSSTVHYSYSPAAWLVYFYSSKVYEDYDDRYLGFSVRPVYGSHDKVSVASVSLDKSHLELSVGASASLSATVLPEDATNKTVVWSSSNAAVASVSSQGEVTGTGMGTAKITAQTVDGDKTAVCSVVVTYSSTSVPEAVDLGLPSGLKWASFNVGAGRQEEYGDYFAWGETEPYYEPGYAQSESPVWKTGKEAGYAWSSYKWCRGSSDSMTKYCTDSSYGYNGFTDGKTVLDPEDDAAHVNLGGKWRIPTDEEWEELRSKCSWKWTTVSGVKGRQVTGPSGKTIFLPAAGGRDDKGPYDTGSYGYYSSSSLDTEEQEFAWGIGFYSSRVGKTYGYRCEGLPVRPVSE